MEKLIFFYHRADGLDREEFQRRYLDEHAPLVLEHCPRLRRYVVNVFDTGKERSEPFEPDGTPLSVDVAVELWYDRMEHYADRSQRYDSPEGAAAVDRSRAELVGASMGYHVDERVQRDNERGWAVGARSPGEKLVAPLRRRADLTHDQFVEHWVHTHSPLALKHVLGMWRYVTNVVIEPVTAGAPETDGIVEVHYMDERSFDSPEGQAIMEVDVAQFLQTPSRLMASEHILRG
ncbi:MAG: EthD domain-containing protein [Dehalococcoidia bacterium]